MFRIIFMYIKCISLFFLNLSLVVNKYAYPCSYHHITVDTYPKIDRLPQLIGTSQFYLLLPNEYRKEAYQEFNMETGQSHVLVNNSAFIYGHKMTEYPCSSFPTRFCLVSLLMAGQCTLYQPKFTQIKHRETGESRRNRWPIYDGLRRVFLPPLNSRSRWNKWVDTALNRLYYHIEFRRTVFCPKYPICTEMLPANIFALWKRR